MIGNMEQHPAPKTPERGQTDQPIDGYRNRPVSWVRRGVRMTEGQEVALTKYGAKYLIDPPRGIARESIASGWRIDPQTVFAAFGLPANVISSSETGGFVGLESDSPLGEHGSKNSNPKPVILEIGIGRGENIVAAAQRHPDINFIGVEVYGPGIARTILQAEQHGGCPNLRLIQADAPELLESLPPAALTEIWVFFPDPWPKTRHLKRRMINPDFARQTARALKPGGIIRFATDWVHYAEQIAEVFDTASEFRPLKTDRFAGRVLTTFEAKGIRAGRVVTDLAYLRN